MKKFNLIIMFFLFFLLNINLIKANEEDITKPIMLLKGYEYNDILNYENYTIVKSTVNYQKTGEYEIEYIHNKTKETYIKKVYIVENSYTHVETKEKQLNQEIELIKTLEDGSLIYTKRVHFDYNDDTIVDYYVCKEKNDEIIWKNLLLIDVIGRIIDIQSDGEFIYVLSNIYTEDTSTDIYIHILNENGELLLTKKYGGSSVENISGMYIDNNNIYVYGSTLSENFGPKHEISSDDSYILVLNKDNLLIKETHLLNEKYLDNIIDCVSYNKNIYVLQQFVNTDVMRVTYRILKINQSSKIVNVYTFTSSIFFKALKMGIFNNHLYILANNINSAELYQLNIDDYKIKIIDTIKSFESIDFYINNSTLTVSYKNDKESMVKIYNDKLETIFKKNFDYKIEKVIDINKVLDNNHKLISIDYTSLSLINDQFIIKYNNDEINNQLDIYIDEKLYGKYQNMYYYMTPIIDFYGYLNTNIALNSSVKNNQVYDNNIKISFNGIGFLNNKPISSNYLINTPGEYKLKILGYNTETTINFEVINITTQQEKYEDNIVITSNKENIFNDNQIKKEYSFEEIQKENKKGAYLYLIFPLISITIFIFVLIRKRG